MKHIFCAIVLSIISAAQAAGQYPSFRVQHFQIHSESGSLRYHFGATDDYGAEFSLYDAAGKQQTRIGADSHTFFNLNGGNVGIGTTNPQAGLHINNSAGPAGGLYIENKHISGNTHFDYPDRKNYIRGTTVFADTGGAVGIGTTSPERLLHVQGTIGASRVETHTLWIGAGTYESSDLRGKEDISALDDALGKILALRGVRFKRAGSDPAASPQIGLIAQDVESLFPEIVGVSPDGMRGINYGRLVAPLIEAVKRQQEQIEELKAAMKLLTAGNHQRRLDRYE